MTLDTPEGIDHNASIEATTPLSETIANVPHGGSFAFIDFLSPEKHLDLLKERGLAFKNPYEEQRFLKLMNTVGYYRLSQYFKHFYIAKNNKKFIPGATAQGNRMKEGIDKVA